MMPTGRTFTLDAVSPAKLSLITVEDTSQRLEEVRLQLKTCLMDSQHLDHMLYNLLT